MGSSLSVIKGRLREAVHKILRVVGLPFLHYADNNRQSLLQLLPDHHPEEQHDDDDDEDDNGDDSNGTDNDNDNDGEDGYDNE